MNRPFPFLKHGQGRADELRLWVGLASAGDVEHALRAWSATWTLQCVVRAEPSVVWLRARGLRKLSAGSLAAAHTSLDAALLSAQAIALVHRDNDVQASDWHRASMADARGVVAALDGVVRRGSTERGYARSCHWTSANPGEDLRKLLVRTTRGALLAEFVALVIATLERGARSPPAQAILHDLILEQLPGLLGVDFDVDVVAREILARVGGRSATSIVMSDAFDAEVRRRTLPPETKFPSGAGAQSWDSVKAVRKAIGARAKWLRNGFRQSSSVHAKTLLALEPAQRLVLVQEHGLAGAMADAALRLLQHGDFRAALLVYDAAIEGSLQPIQAANPLYAVSPDNNKLPLDPVRARRYLERCLPHGAKNSNVFLNAAFVLMELGDHDEALRMLAAAKQVGAAVKTHQHEPLLVPLRDRPEFKALMR